MRISTRAVAASLGAAVCAASLFAAPGSASAAITFEHAKIQVTVAADGTYTALSHLEATADNDASAAQLGQVPLAFNPSLERLDVVEAYTRKQDGTRKDVDPAAIRTQLAPGVANVPTFRDIQQKVVVFPDLAAHDTQVLTFRRTVLHPLFPGQFTWSSAFPRDVGWSDAAIEVSAPADYALQTQSILVPMEKVADGDRIMYRWHYSAPSPARENYAVDPIDRRPRLFLSSFPGYDAMAAAYSALASPKQAVTPLVQAKADEITAGITDRREQARALYEWVSRHVRYVAVYLNRGGVEPHAADAVLANGYGDCKDHVVLLSALLKAKGIESRAVLVNLGLAYSLSGPPTLAQLNHVLTYIPEFDLYADSTLGTAAFGTLSYLEYGKPIVVVGARGGSLRLLPMPSPDATEIRVSTKARVLSDGQITGATETTATGAAAVSLRQIERLFQSQGGPRERANASSRCWAKRGPGISSSSARTA